MRKRGRQLDHSTSLSRFLSEGGSDFGVVDSSGVGDGECVQCALPAPGAASEVVAAFVADVAYGEEQDASASIMSSSGLSLKADQLAKALRSAAVFR